MPPLKNARSLPPSIDVEDKAVSQLSTLSCAEYLRNGQLQILLPNLPLEKWQFYLYRPYQTLTPKRVLVVFDVLEKILKERFGERE